MSDNGTMRVAIPTDAPGGMEAARSAHFGHADCFTLLDVADGRMVAEAVLGNPHDQGGCLAPVMMLADVAADAIVVGGIGGRPLAAFREAGIRVVLDRESLTAGAAVQRLLSGDATEVDDRDACAHHGHDHGEGCAHGA